MIEATIARDSEGFPSLVTLQDGAKRLEVAFDRDTGFTISGSRRSFTTELLDVLRMIYPATVDFKFNIPQPLAVTQVGGGVVLFDDMESALLKWEGVAGTVALDNTFAYNGGQSLQVTCAALDTVAYARRYFPLPTSRKIRIEALWAIDNIANLNLWGFDIAMYTSSQSFNVNVWYNQATMNWQIAGGGGVFYHAERDVQVVLGVGGAWHKLAFTLDFVKHLGYDFEINQHAINAEVALVPAFGAVDEQNYIQMRVNNAAGTDLNMWFDDVKIMEIK